MECIIHYESSSSYSVIKKLSETNIERINLAKEKRLQLGGAHHHFQCDQIPKQLNLEIHGVHLEPCYKR